MKMAGGSEGQREAIVLAGGRGTRLAAVLPDRQKVTANVGGTPFALRLAQWLGEAGVNRVVFAAGHRAKDVEALTADSGQRPELVVCVEPRPLGTGGAARFAASRTRANPVLVLNGDSIAEIDLRALYGFHRERHAAVTLALAPVPDTGRYGLVHTEADGRVASFHEKVSGVQAPGWINAGVYLFERDALLSIPSNREVSLEREIFPALIGKGLYAMRFDARFIDIGTPESLGAAGAFFGTSEP